MAKTLVVIGTRPEGIKLAPVIAALRNVDTIETRVALTGQHTDLMDQVLQVFDLEPDWDLGIMREGQDLYDVTRECLTGLRGVISGYRPDLVLVEGDTASVFLAGLVSFYEKVRVGHVEAGLRSGDKWRPWPEEIFRRLTGVVADLHFAPTPRARDNLLRENVPADNIHVTGNTVVDALLAIATRGEPARSAELQAALDSGQRLLLLTAHRRESFGEPLRRAFGAIRTLADRFDDIVVLYPVHPNPNVREAALAVLGEHPRIRLTEPLDYLDLVRALERATLVFTDSGGIQEEAPTFGVPVLVMREVTERPEAVEAGVALLVGTDPDRMLEAGTAVLEGRAARLMPGLGSRLRNPYGDGRAGERIADIVVSELTGAPRRTADWTGPQ